MSQHHELDMISDVGLTDGLTLVPTKSETYLTPESKNLGVESAIHPMKNSGPILTERLFPIAHISYSFQSCSAPRPLLQRDGWHFAARMDS